MAYDLFVIASIFMAQVQTAKRFERVNLVRLPHFVSIDSVDKVCEDSAIAATQIVDSADASI